MKMSALVYVHHTETAKSLALIAVTEHILAPATGLWGAAAACRCWAAALASRAGSRAARGARPSRKGSSSVPSYRQSGQLCKIPQVRHPCADLPDAALLTSEW